MSQHAPASPHADTIRAGEAPVPGVELARGAAVGRYLVLEKIGAGGMGVVYAAYDSKLDRRVALKALRSQDPMQRDTTGRSRLFREAQAMARLSHPNVVTVYDVLIDGDEVFVAMELIEGQTLQAWLATSRRSWREIVGAFVQAGRGLAAAHQAGIVHRDFKVDNVFVGKDGRARVGDFGLARVANAPAPSAHPASDSPAPLASHEGIAGTPAYMAFEQLMGAAADQRSDQFSFCVALYEALYGERPFEGATLASLISSMDEGRLRPAPRDRAVPSRLRVILGRGLKKRPEDRYPSMEALLAELEADPNAARRRQVGFGVFALALAAVGVAAVHVRRAEALACRAGGAEVDEVWSDKARRSVHEAFLASNRPYAEDTFARTSLLLDSYATSWSAGTIAACDGGAVRGGENPPLALQRAQCFTGRLDDLRALVGVLGRADGEVVDRAVQAARALPDIAPCAGNDPLRGEALPSDPAVRADVQAALRQVSLAAALRGAGRYAEGTELASEAVADAQRIGFAPLLADAVLLLAEVQADAGLTKESEASFHRATVAGEAAGSTRVAASAWIGLARAASDRNEFALADERFDLAEAYVDRTGDDLLRGDLLLVRGDHLTDEGKPDDARPLHEKALAIFERVGSDKATTALNALGIDFDLGGHYPEARAYYERALERYERLLGPDHPLISKELNNLGVMASDNGRFDEAYADLKRSLAICEHALGPQHRLTAQALYNLADAYNGGKRFDDALVYARRATNAVDKALGPDHPDMGYASASLGEALFGLHRTAEALEPLERALAIRSRAAAPANLAESQLTLGEALFELGREPDRARALLLQARETFASLDRPRWVNEIDDVLRDHPATRR